MRRPEKSHSRDPRLALGVLLLAGLALPATPIRAAEPDPRQEFFERLAALCGAVYEGTSSFPEEGDFAGKLLVAEIADCDDNEIRVPFGVAEDTSRTWIVRYDDEGLLLKHDHRHPDGTPDEITMYGGWATEDGTALSQSFPADAHTRQLLPEAATNVWSLTIDPAAGTLTYYLERHGEPRFEAVLSRRAEPAAPRENGGT